MRPISIFLLFVMGIQGQDIPRPNGPPTLRVHGQSTVTAEPDQVQLDIGVVAQAASAKAAAEQNAVKSNALIQELHTLLLPPANVNNINFSVNPIYRYPPQGVPVIAGYTASNTLRLLLGDISKLPGVIDIAIKSGANSINRLAFTLHDQNPVTAQALAEAASQARAGADALAVSMKVKLGRLLSIEEGQPVIVSPPREISFEKLQSTAVSPISPGTIDVHADVNLTYEIVETNPR